MKRFIFAVCATGSLTAASFAAVDGTMGTPLGGVGAGAIRFCAYTGSFYFAETTPLALNNFQLLTNACFQMYTNRGGTVQTSQQLKAVQTSNRADDDAIYPIHTANLGVTNNVSVSLTAFSPVCFDSVDLMCYPYAFFELTLTNTAATPVDAAVAMQISTTSTPAWVSGKGIKTTGGIERALYAIAGPSGAVISAGSDNGFLTSGQCNNTITGTTNKVAVKLTLAAQASGTIKFVYSWYNGSDTARFYYANAFTNAGSVADVGLSQFDRFMNNAVQIVTRMRASNVPDWIRDQTLNSLCNLTTSSIYTKDGRHCYTEGEWNTNGTMDQMWHARQIMTMTVPDLAWNELEYWARTQKTNPLGQIHHDMGAPMTQLWGWDDQQHLEYAYQPDCNPWVDLNCAFIISVYEAYCATGNKTKLDYFWPYVKNSGQRILDQVKTYGNTQYPYTFETSLNTYDQPSNNLNPYNGGLSSVAYKIMTVFATIYGDTALKSGFQNALDTSKISFQNRYLTNDFPTETRFVESILAGQWISFYLKFGQLYSQAAIDYGLSMADAHYQAATTGLGFTARTYQEWAPYLISHYGGLCLETGQFGLWRSLQYDWYERTYLDRNLVFNVPLDIPAKVTTPNYFATDSSVWFQYISIPVLWRNYYTIVGYQRNKPTGELWLEPMIPPEMNHSLKSGFYLSPEGFGTVSDTESGASFENQAIMFKPDKPVQVSSIYLRDKSADSNVTVKINNVAKTVTRLGEGYAKELKVDYSGIADSSGLSVIVTYGNAGIKGGAALIRRIAPRSITLVKTGDKIVLPAAYSGRPVSVALYNSEGRLLGMETVSKAVLDLRKDFSAAKGVYIVRVTPVK